MKNPQIKYKDIMSLGFTEDRTPCDQVYYNEYGFKYRIYQLQLTDTIYLDWQKETRLCKLVRIDHPDKGNIRGVIDIEDLNHLKQIVKFFSDGYTADFRNAC